MTTSNRRMWALSLAVVLGAVAAACAEDAQVSIVRSDQDGRTSVPSTDPDDTVTVTETAVVGGETNLGLGEQLDFFARCGHGGSGFGMFGVGGRAMGFFYRGFQR